MFYSKEVNDKINEIMKPFKEIVKTITFDNGKEFARHKEVAIKLNCKTYFALASTLGKEVKMRMPMDF